MFSRLAISKPGLSSSKYSTKASEYIKSLLKLLPEEFAIPLYMYDLENISQKDIAEKLNLTLPNTKSRIQRGRLKLKERFLECCIVEFDENGEMISFDIKPDCKLLQDEKNKLKNLV
jgi:RNA polymerase sigma-70 factor (ECF subfamily)